MDPFGELFHQLIIKDYFLIIDVHTRGTRSNKKKGH